MMYLSPKLTLLMLSVVPPVALASVSIAHFLRSISCYQRADMFIACSSFMGVTLGNFPIAPKRHWARCHRKRKNLCLRCALSKRSTLAIGKKVNSRSRSLRSWSLEEERLGQVAYFLVGYLVGVQIGSLCLNESLRFSRVYRLGW